MLKDEAGIPKMPNEFSMLSVTYLNMEMRSSIIVCVIKMVATVGCTMS